MTKTEKTILVIIIVAIGFAVGELCFGLEITNVENEGESRYMILNSLQGKENWRIYRNAEDKIIRDEWLGTHYIRTSNRDASYCTDNFLSFDVDTSVRVFVAHDDKVANKPEWLQDWFYLHGSIITTETTYSRYWNVFPAGHIVLGGNSDSGAINDSGRMYLIGVQEYMEE